MVTLNLFGYTLTVETDTILPLLINPASDLVVQCGDDYSTELSKWYGLSGGATASDNSGEVSVEPTIDLPTVLDSLNNSLGSFCNPENIFEVGFYAIDTCGNTSIDTSFARFQISDTQRPNLISRASSVVLACDEFSQDSLDNWVRSFGGASAVDVCSPTVDWFRIIWNDNQGNSSIGHPTDGPLIPIVRNNCGWEVTVSFFVRDVCGNNQITTASFSLIDTIAPQFLEPLAEVEVTCDDILAGIEVSDNCNTDLSPSFEDISSTRSLDSTSCEFFNYTLNRLWTVTDDCGNSNSFQQMISVVDTIIPSFVVPQDITIFCNDDAQTSITGFPTEVFDNCNPNPLVIFTDSGETEGCDFVISRFWQIADGCGSSNIVPQQITVMDTIKPVIILEATDLLLNCENPDSLSSKFDAWLGNIGGASARDDCGSIDWFAAVPESYDLNDSNTFPGDLINSIDDINCGTVDVIVDFVFVDDCGNGVVTSAIFTLTDNIPPVFVEPFEDIILDVDSMCMANTIMLFPMVSDNCVQDSQVVKTIRFGNDFIPTPEGRFDTVLQAGVYDFAYIISDCSGNADSIVSTVTILDNIDPSIICPENMVSSVDQSTCVAEVILSADFLSQENCNIQSLTYSVSGSTIVNSHTVDPEIDSISVSLNAGLNLIEYVARDKSGNEASCTFSIDVNEIEVQDIECKSETIYLPISNPNPFVLSDSVFIENLVDNCFIDSIFIPIMNVTCDQIGETIGVQLTIFDRTGSSQNCTSILMIEAEDINPSFENKFCSSDTLRLFANIPDVADIDQNVYSWIGPNNYVSSVSNPVLTGVDSTFSGIYSLTVTGEAGCTQTDSVMVQVETFQTPTLTISQEGSCIGDSIILESSSYDFSVLYSWYDGLFPDGNLFDTSSLRQISFVPSQGVHDYYVVVSKDDCTSSPSNAINIVFQDVSPPLITCPADTVINLDGAVCSTNYLLPNDYVVSDDCGVADSLVVNYLILGGGVAINDSLKSTNSNRIDSLEVGDYTATYSIRDLAGNPDSCSFLISLVDTIPPQLTCKNDSVDLSIAKLNNFSINDLDILSGATDNCQLDTILYAPNKIDCAIIGEQITITVNAIDISGNSSECTSVVNIALDTLMIDYESGLCPGDTLMLSSNIIDTTGLNFDWSGPAGFISSDPSPIISNPTAQNNGIYLLSVGSDRSCNVSAEVEVALVEIATPFITTNASLVCTDEELELRTQNYGAGITYSWYRGLAPEGVLLSEVSEPTFTLIPELGMSDFYVIISNAECSSEPSEEISLEAVSQPDLDISTESRSVCTGDTFFLSVGDINNDLSYTWSGPNGYISNEGNPATEIIADANTIGIYSVIGKIGECVSDTVRIEIVLQEDDGVLPIIEGETSYCEGSTIEFQVENISEALSYTWLKDGIEYSTTEESNLIINDVGEQESGAWQVSVEGFCGIIISEELQIIVSEDLAVVASSNSPICGSSSLQLAVNDFPDAIYNWEGPNGFTSNERSPILDPVAGEYTVTVSVGQTCESVSSTLVEIKGRPAVQEINSNISPCGATVSELILTPVTSANETYTYEWTGPNGFSSPEEVVTIENFNTANEGVYSLIISNGECESLLSNIVISTGDGIEQPTIIAAREICTGQSIVLELEDLMIDVDEYIWTTPQGTERTVEPTLTITDASSTDSGDYSLVISSDDCTSESSEPITINVGSVLVTPSIVSKGPFCRGETIQLQVDMEDGEYEWRGPNDFQAFDANPVIFNISTSFVGSYEVRVVGEDCTSPWSQPFDLQLVDVPVIPIPTSTEYMVCINDTVSYDLCIEESTVIEGATYYWLVESTGDTIGGTANACLSVTSSEKLSLGQNNINVVASIGDCSSGLSRQVSIILTDGEGGDLVVNAGDDISVCEDIATIEGQLNDGETGSWSSPNSEISFSNPTSASSEANGFEEGENILIWTVQGQSCSGKGSDTLRVFYAFEPMIVDDEFNFVAGQQIIFDPLQNDELPSDITVEIVSLIGGERIDATDPRAIRLGVEDGFGGEIEVIYEVCNESCPELCGQGVVIISIEGQEECLATTLITPNGDGLNDNFEISCLEGGVFPDHELIIFNQWGDEVYAAQSYQNNWQGTFNGEDLPVGTYFFILKLGDGLKNQDGFIQLER